MKLLINGYKTTIKTKVNNDRLIAKAVITDLDGMSISITGTMEEGPESVINRAIKKVKDEFCHMAAMAVGYKEDLS